MSKIDAPVEDDVLGTCDGPFHAPTWQHPRYDDCTDWKPLSFDTSAPVEDTAENHCPACLQGQSLEAGEGTHREGTVEHPVEDAAVQPDECFLCRRTMSIRDGYDPTEICDACAHEFYVANKDDVARTRELEKRLAEAEGLLREVHEANMFLTVGHKDTYGSRVAAFLSQGSEKTK